MKRMLVCSEGDLPSENMREALLGMREWEDAGSKGGERFHVLGDTVMMSSPRLHIHMDEADSLARDAGFDVGEIVFMSRHSAASGEPSLTVHPIGNYGEAKYGGRAGTLAPAAPSAMSSALRAIARQHPPSKFRVCFEATHHGPLSRKPTYFIEIGSDERNWGDRQAAEILANALLAGEDDGCVDMIGVGGGHYAPRFTDIALGYRANFGHMVPGYQMEGRGDEEVAGMIRSACEASGTRLAYLHRGGKDSRMESLIASAGAELVRSSDLEPISNPRTCL